MPQKHDGYERKKQASAAREESQSRAGREIGGIPPIENIERREAASRDLFTYGQEYHSELLYLGTSSDQMEMIRAIESAVLNGDLQAMAMPRGSGKTTWCEIGVEWATLNGHHQFSVPIGATEPHAENMLSTIKSSLEQNDELLADYPEAVYPIRCLEGIVNRCKGQLLNGERTLMEWTAKQIVFPTVRLPADWKGPRRADGFSISSTAVIKVAGITGSIRGMKYKGRRPTLVVPDDPQTRESAKSFEQSSDRVKTLMGDVLGLAGPGKKICGLMPCTVIYPGDMADQILDHKLHPEWRGLRKKLVYSFPTSTKWDQYADILKDSQTSGGNSTEATEFYRENQEEMDAGAIVSWPDRFNTDELSAVQNAMNLKIRDEAAFYAEYQNEPVEEKTGKIEPLSADQVAGKFNRLARGIVPLGCNVLTAMIDVQKDYLLWGVAAINSQGFTGAILDYGLWPETKRQYFRLSDDLPTLLQMYPGGSRDNAWFQGIVDCIAHISGRDWMGENGQAHKLDGGMVDAQYGESTDSVYQAIRHSPHGRDWLPSHGRGIAAGQKSITQWADKPGDKKGLNWRIRMEGVRGQKHILYGTNEWKTFFAERLRTPMGDKGSLSLFGDRPSLHRMFAEHCTAEVCQEKTVNGQTSLIWSLIPGRENHLLDIGTGCLMRGSTLGCSTLGLTNKPRGQAKKKFTYAEKMAKKRTEQAG